MAYNVYLTDGNGAAVVNDGTLNNDYSVTLIGKGVADYGSVLAQNSIHQLENFASYAPPANPLIGQLWYNKSDTILYVFDGDVFYPLDKHLPKLTVDEFFSPNITAGNITVANISGHNLSFNNGYFDDLNVGNLLTVTDIHAGKIESGNVIANFTGNIGDYAPAAGAFTTLKADSFTGNLYGRFNGVIGDLQPNTAAFTDVSANNIRARNIYGNLSGSIGQLGYRYLGSFTELDADDIISRNAITGRTITATGGFVGNILTNAQPNITSVGVLDNLTVAHTTQTDVLRANLIYGAVATNNQPYINSLGDLNNLRVIGNTVLNAVYANLLNAHEIQGTISTANQPLIQGLGTLFDLKVVNPIDGNLAGTADHAKRTDVANLAIQVTGNIQPNITSLGTLSHLEVNGPVDLGNVQNIRIGGGYPNQWLGINNAGRLTWGFPNQIPDYSNASGYVLSNDGVNLEWIYNDTTLIKSLKPSDITTVTLAKGDPDHTPYTVLNIDMTDLISAEIYLQFYEQTTGDYYDGTLGISLFPDTQTYSVTPLSFGGPTVSTLQIHTADGSGWGGYPAFTDITQIPIQIFNANIIKNVSADARTVKAIQWTWVHKIYAPNLITPVTPAPAVDGYIREQSPINTIAYTARAIDPDPAVTIIFSLKPGYKDDYLLDIDANSGDVTLKTPAVYAVKNRYYAAVIATSSYGLSTEKDIVIAVSKFDNAPVITSAQFVDAMENKPATAIIYVATATNPNTGSFTTWSIDPTSPDASKFNIDSALGVLRFNTSPLYTDQQTYYITLIAADGITPSAFDTLSLTVQLIKQPPVFV